MTNELIEKLRTALNKKLSNEAEYIVVYILSRIRKLIEKNGSRKKYRVLNIYCNWTLHNQIDNTADISDILEEFINNKEKRDNFLYFTDFKNEFRTFISDTLDEKVSDEYLDKFTKILAYVISDTPITLKGNVNATITINPPIMPKIEGGIGYKIEFV